MSSAIEKPAPVGSAEAPSTPAHPPGSPSPGQAGEDDLAALSAKEPDHEFKSAPSVFYPAARGEKLFEYRRDDRGGYHVGQKVRLRCYDIGSRSYLPEPPVDRVITNILRGGDFELPVGYCVLGLAPLDAGRLVSRTAAQAAPDGTGLECKNCGSRKDLKEIQAEGYRSCCPERDMVPLAAAPAAPAQGGGDDVIVPRQFLRELQEGFDNLPDLSTAQAEHLSCQITAALAYAPEAQGGGDGWQPISTASKDGTHLLVARAEAKPVRGYFQAGRWWMHGCGPWSRAIADLTGEHAPTHWRPLPAPPSTEIEGR